jgi:hypothetical protein
MAEHDPNPRNLMKMFRAEPLRIWPISARANKPDNDDPAIWSRSTAAAQWPRL